jgi:hypothetical protein
MTKAVAYVHTVETSVPASAENPTGGDLEVREPPVARGAGLAFAAALGAQHGGLVILIFGVGVAIFWSGFLRVGAQSALLLAPLSALALLFAWALRTPVLPLP